MDALLDSLLPALRVLVLAGEVAELADVQTKRFVRPSRQAKPHTLTTLPCQYIRNKSVLMNKF